MGQGVTVGVEVEAQGLGGGICAPSSSYNRSSVKFPTCKNNIPKMYNGITYLYENYPMRKQRRLDLTSREHITCREALRIRCYS